MRSNHLPARGLAATLGSQSWVARRDRMGHGRGIRQRRQRRHEGRLDAAQAAGIPSWRCVPDDRLRARRAGWAGRLRVRRDVPGAGSAGIPGGEPELPRQLGSGKELLACDLRRLGQSRDPGHPCGDGQPGRRGTRRPRSPRHRRLELRWHEHQLRHRQRHEVLRGGQRRLDLEHDHRLTAPTSTPGNTRARSGCRGRGSTLT